MKTYKILTGWVINLEDEINALAKQGWVLKNLVVAFEGDDNTNENAYAVMEFDDEDTSDLLNELELVNEKLNKLIDSMPKSQINDLDNVIDELREIKKTLGYIENNTSQ
jgi:hypothetical protein